MFGDNLWIFCGNFRKKNVKLLTKFADKIHMMPIKSRISYKFDVFVSSLMVIFIYWILTLHLGNFHGIKL